MKPWSLWLFWTSGILVAVALIIADDALAGYALLRGWNSVPAAEQNSLVGICAMAGVLQVLFCGGVVLFASRRRMASTWPLRLLVFLIATAAPLWLSLNLGNTYELFLGDTRQISLSGIVSLLSLTAIPFVAFAAFRSAPPVRDPQ